MSAARIISLTALFAYLSALLQARYIVDCTRCAHEHLLRSPAVAFDLGMDTLTIAIRYVNGTVAPLSKVRAGEEYQTLLREWARNQIKLNGEADELSDDSKLKVKALTPEAKVLSTTLQRLIDKVIIENESVDLRNHFYAVSVPPFVSDMHVPYDEQALHHSHFRMVEKPSIYQSDGTTHSVANAVSCSVYTHPRYPRCSSDRSPSSVSDALVIDYSPSALIVTWHFTPGFLTYRQAGIADTELGGRLLRDRHYWQRMRDTVQPILHAVEDSYSKRAHLPPSEMNPNQVLFIGPLGGDQLMREVFRDLLDGTCLGLDKSFLCDAGNSVFASALGAAEIRKAELDAPEPAWCDESWECEQLRERVYEEALARDLMLDL